jgi:hypothetical protein
LKSLLNIALASAAALAIASSAHATVVTFDDLPGAGVVADGYNGITWNGEWNFYDSVQPPYTPASGATRVYDFLSDASFSFAAPVVFDGASFSGYDFAPVNFQLWLGGVQVGASGTLTPTGTPTFLASGYSGLVDEVHVQSPSPDFFVMDDVTFNSSGAVPEPATWTMMIAGFGLAGAALRRRRVAIA